MAKLNEVVSKDENWKAFVELRGYPDNLNYAFVVRSRKYSILRALLGKEKFPRTRRVGLGASYFDPSSQFQAPEMPVGRSLGDFSVRFTEIHAELDYTEKLYYEHRPPQKNPEKIRVPIA